VLPGSGTFVRPRPFASRLGPLRSLAREIAARAGELRTEVLGASFVAAPPGVAARLGLDAAAEVFVIDRLAEDAGVTVARASETIESVALGAAEAALLGREAGAPALLSRRLTFDTGDLPAVEDRAVLPGDRVVMTAERAAAGGVDLTYSLTGGDARTR
jgi:DNA-binding GntR family transcriptional regulator